MKSWWHWLALLIAVVVVFNLRATGRASNKPKKVAARPAAAKAVGETIDGYGATPEKARDRALERARDRVGSLLEERLRGTGWAPAPELMELDLLTREKVIREDGEPTATQLQEEKGFVARYNVELTTGYLKEIETAARREKVEERHALLARLLGGILAVALVTAAYLRLEETTRGYATKLLRLSAALVLAVVGAGLWLTR